jgi:hypothetical protein
MMRSNTLLFAHVLLAVALLGSVLATTVASHAAASRTGRAADILRRFAWRSALLVVVAVVATIALGEALRSHEDIAGAAWLDATYGLAYFGLLVPGGFLAILARLALERPQLARPLAGLGGLTGGIALAEVFVMAAKP